MPTNKKVDEAIEEIVKEEVPEEKETLDEYVVLYETTIGSFFFEEGDIVRVPHGTVMNNTNLKLKGEINKPKVQESEFFDPTTI